jgi:multidrug efflux pump subunit AcrA (membrane-fusion protein)
MRWIAITLIAAAIGWGIYLALTRHSGPPPAAAPQSGSAGEPADRGGLRIFAGGTVEGAQRELSLQFEIPGRIREIRVQPGSRVAKGDVLAQLDPELAELKFTEARTLLQLARTERDRLIRQQEELRQKQERTAGELPLRRARAEEIAALNRADELTMAEAKVALAEGALRRERIMLEKCLLVAPTDGVVLRVLGEAGELVGPNDDRHMVTLVNRDRTRVRAHVEELDAMQVAVGQKAVVTAEGEPDRAYQGVVKSCSPYVAPKSHRHLKPGELFDVRVREVIIELADGADLLVGLPVDVFIDPQAAGKTGSPAYDDRGPAVAPQTVGAPSPAGQTSRRFTDADIRPASHLAETGRRK